jgi:hypothetical protein
MLLPNINETFLDIFKKKHISDLIKVHPVGAQLFLKDGQMDGQTKI